MSAPRSSVVAQLFVVLGCHGHAKTSPDAPSSFTIGGTAIGLDGAIVLTDNGGDALTVSADGPFTFAASLANGSSYQVAISKQPTQQVCSVAAGEGTVGAGDVTNIVVSCPHSRFVYTPSFVENELLGYAVAPTTGRLEPVTRAATGQGPVSVVVDSRGQNAYVLNANDKTISHFAIADDGALTATPVVANGGEVLAMVLDPSNSHAYVASGTANVVAQYTISPDGSLTPMTPPTVPTGMDAFAISIDPSGRYVYVANINDNTVSQYTIDANGGLVAMASPTVAVGTEPGTITIDPSGRYAYVGNWTGATISQLAIAADGSLSPMTPAAVATGNVPDGIAIEPSGRFAYVSVAGSTPTVWQYAIGPTGALMPLAGQNINLGIGEAIVADSRNVYVATFGHGIGEFAIGVDGTLSPLAPAVVAAPNNIQSIAAARGNHAVQSFDTFAYVTDFSASSVSQFSIGSSGTLAPLTPASVSIASTGVVATDLDPFGGYAYVASTNVVSTLAIGRNGTLSGAGTVAGSAAPNAIAVHPAGNAVYVATTTSILQYTATNGQLVPMSVPSVTASNPNALVIDPAGENAYVALLGSSQVGQFPISSGALGTAVLTTITGGPREIVIAPSGRNLYVTTAGTVVAFGIDPSSGAITPKPPVSAGNQSFGLAIDSSETHLYVANFGDNTISQYEIAADGSLFPLTPPTIATGSGPEHIVLDATGHVAYVVNSNDNTVSQFSIDANGGLIPMGTVTTGAFPAWINAPVRYH
jgi:6-phosphogluconolactonase (cycloisomerase 2 family)